MALIIVAEDNAAERGLVARALQSDGHAVIEVENGQVGLAQLQAHPDVQVVVTDVEMPEVDGIELAKRAMASNPRIKVLLISGLAGGAERARELVAAGARMLVKPVALETVRAEVRALVG